MNIETVKTKSEDKLIPISDVLEKISNSSIQKINEQGHPSHLVGTLRAATSFLTDYFEAEGDAVQYLSQLNSDSLSKLRVYLRVFSPDTEEMSCVLIMEAAIAIGVELECIDEVALAFWRKVSPVSWFRQNSPLY